MQSSRTTTPGEREEQAIRHLLALENGGGPAERAEAEAWIARAPENAVAFTRARAAWRATAMLDAEPEVSHEDTAPTRRGFVLGALAAFAAGVAALGAGAWWWRREAMRTGVGEIRQVTLPDGSRMMLNSDSVVEVAYRPARRLLRLRRGEAFFDVAHNPDRPFDVEVRGTTLRALGTAFNVREREAVVELTVSHGIVGVTEGATQLRPVAAGHFAIIHPDALAVVPYDRAGLSQKIAWRDHVIELNGDSVAQAVDEFNRYRTRPIVIGDQRVAALRVGGRFQIDESTQFIEGLEQSMPIRAVKDADGGVLLLYADETPEPARPA